MKIASILTPRSSARAVVIASSSSLDAMTSFLRFSLVVRGDDERLHSLDDARTDDFFDLTRDKHHKSLPSL